MLYTQPFITQVTQVCIRIAGSCDRFPPKVGSISGEAVVRLTELRMNVHVE